MIDTLILTSATILLSALLYFEKRDSTRGRLLTKPFLSALFVAVVLAGPKPDPIYACLVLAGLLFCMAGDIFLIFFASQRLILVCARIVFNRAYPVQPPLFFCLSRPGMLTWVAGAGLRGVQRHRLCLAAAPSGQDAHTGRHICDRYHGHGYRRRISSWARGLSETSPAGRSYFPGPSSSTSSDIFVARQQFVARQYLNRLVGLPLYYLGQFMIAYSVRFL